MLNFDLEIGFHVFHLLDTELSFLSFVNISKHFDGGSYIIFFSVHRVFTNLSQLAESGTCHASKLLCNFIKLLTKKTILEPIFKRLRKL